MRILRTRTLVVDTRTLAELPNWVSITYVMKSVSDPEFLRAAGAVSFDDSSFERSTRLLHKPRDRVSS